MTSQKSFYLTKEGLRALREEFETLRARRMEYITEDSESRDELELIEKRLHVLSEALQSHTLITLPKKHERDEVRLGATVLARSKTTGKTETLRLVGTFEANPLLGTISDESPFGQALLGHRVGDEVAHATRADLRYVIEKILYEPETHRA
ncbi:MAG: GreA/GreB family elongation factor [Patescibacteria group bacterium]